jgi:hypothetical protein
MTRGTLAACLITLVVVLSSAARAEAPPLTAERLRAHFAAAPAFTAEVEQQKHARFLARPLTSQVKLTYEPGRIVWQTVAPVASRVVIDRDGLHVEAAGGAAATGGAAEAAMRDPRALALVGFIRNLFALDFAELQKQFSLRFTAQTLLATPRPESNLNGLIDSIELRFDAGLELESVEVRTPDETTRLAFKHVQRASGSPAAAKGAQ